MSKSANDNCEFRGRLYRGTCECLLPFVNDAQYLIEKYTSFYWKQDKLSYDYLNLEMDIAISLENIARSSYASFLKVEIEFLAPKINIPVLTLYNDERMGFGNILRSPEFIARDSDREDNEFRKALHEQYGVEYRAPY